MKNSLILFCLALSHISFANVTLPNLFSDNMVLQRNTAVAIWGWANPSEEIHIITSWDQKEYIVKAGNQANWKTMLNTPDAGGPYTISIKGYNEVILKNILIGEVWICSGQSNMEYSASWGMKDAAAETAKANAPTIRLFTVPKMTAATPQNNLNGSWVACTPETMKYFSAAGYFFGKRLQEDLKNVPIGLISSNWGGSAAEIWMPEEVVSGDATLSSAAKNLTATEYCPNQPARAYNAMIVPLVDFKIAGAIWYQGESNVGSQVYDKTFSALITSWRKLWKYDFPFYFVQIAPYNYGADQYSGVIIRDAQRKVLQEVSNTGMVVTSDISTPDDIHPKDKKPVGVRLANLALANTYKTYKDIPSGPLFSHFKISKEKVTVYFDYNEGLYFKDKQNTGFEVAGNDGVFYPAKAVIKDGTVVVQSGQVKSPAHIRFEWNNTAAANLFNKANLPASGFLSE